MKKLNLLIFALMVVVQLINAQSHPFRVATFNIRLETSADSGVRAWQKRKFDVARIIHQYKFDLIGVQEVGNASQEADLKKLVPEFTYLGKGRDSQDGSKGEQI